MNRLRIHWLAGFVQKYRVSVPGDQIGRHQNANETHDDQAEQCGQNGSLFSRQEIDKSLSHGCFFSVGVMKVILVVVVSSPGMARLTVEAVFTQDEPLVMASVMMATLMLVIGNLLADLLLGRIDPRIGVGA